MVATPALLSRNNPLKKPGFDSYEEYHPYGTTAWQAPELTAVSLKRYKYAGMERDEETGLQRHGVRYYATWLGRWTSADPIGLGDGVNRYGYCHGAPVGGTDESGMADDARFDPARLRAAIVGAARSYLAQQSQPDEHPGFGLPKFPKAFDRPAPAAYSTEPAAPSPNLVTFLKPEEKIDFRVNLQWTTPSEFLDVAETNRSTYDCRTNAGVWVAEGVRRVTGDLRFDAMFSAEVPLALPFGSPGRLTNLFDEVSPKSRQVLEGDVVYFANSASFHDLITRALKVEAKTPEFQKALDNVVAWRGEWAVKVGVDAAGQDLFAGHPFADEQTAGQIRLKLVQAHSELATAMGEGGPEGVFDAAPPDRVFTVAADWAKRAGLE